MKICREFVAVVWKRYKCLMDKFVSDEQELIESGKTTT